jgi:hypothetical protein
MGSYETFSLKENVMSVIASLKLVEFKPENAQGRIVMRRRKLIEKIEQQMKLATDPTYAPTKLIWVADDAGIRHLREVSKRTKRWWVENTDGSVQLTIRYGSKPLELAKGKNAVLCDSTKAMLDTLQIVRQAVINGELDSILNGQIRAVRKVRTG